MPNSELRDLTYGARSWILMAFATRLGIVDRAQAVFLNLLHRVEVRLIGVVHRLRHKIGVDGLVVEPLGASGAVFEDVAQPSNTKPRTKRDVENIGAFFIGSSSAKGEFPSTRWVGDRVPQSKHSELEGREWQYIWGDLFLTTFT